ncbi:MAG: dihydrofolate reductase family protein [Actinomycetota bacterium]|nr:dihydrofolate reductase family protein [Actinomycetota bacterium]
MFYRMEGAESVDLFEMLFGDERDHPDRPWVMLNMVESIDGATAVRGGATALNDEDDRALFLALRAVADVVMVGAQTVRSEDLGPVKMSADMMKARQANGVDGEPKLAILTNSLDIDPGHRVFSDQERRPMIITSNNADTEKLQSLSQVADIVHANRLDGQAIVEAVGPVDVLLCEGGPSINSQLVESGMVDEINLTLSPIFALGHSKRIASGPELDPPTELKLDRVLRGDRSMFLRYVR